MPRFDELTMVLARKPGPLGALNVAIRARHPELLTSHVGSEEETQTATRGPTSYVVVTGNKKGPWRIVWRNGHYWWHRHINAGPLGDQDSVNDVADLIARELGVR